MGKEKNSGKLYTIYRILLFILMALIVLIVGVGIFSIMRGQDSKPIFKIGNDKPQSTNQGKNQSPAQIYSGDINSGINVFNGMGRLRIPIAAGKSAASPATLILSIAFPYQADDLPFTEELASKINNFKSICHDYFSSLSSAAFVNFDEDKHKKELLKKFNSILRLGKIETLYFNDLLLVEP